MKKIIVTYLFLLSSACLNFCFGQYVRPGDSQSPYTQPTQLPKSSFADNLSVGGSFGLQFGDITFIELEPLLSYHFNQSFMVGIGPIYQYENVQYQVYGLAYTSSLYGARITALYFLPEDLSRIFIMGEFDELNLPEVGQFTYQLSRGYLSLPMLGIGYKEAVSDKAFFCIYGLWNFNNSYYNPFTNPLINVGFDISLGR